MFDPHRIVSPVHGPGEPPGRNERAVEIEVKAAPERPPAPVLHHQLHHAQGGELAGRPRVKRQRRPAARPHARQYPAVPIFSLNVVGSSRVASAPGSTQVCPGGVLTWRRESRSMTLPVNAWNVTIGAKG